MKVAIVHDWLTTYAGAERVLGCMLEEFPNADLFAVCDFLSGDDRKFLGGRRVHTTFIQSLPGARKSYRNYLALMPIAVEQLDLTEYDVVISSSHAVAKGVITGPRQLHVSYVHTPIRYAWDMQHQYLRESGFGVVKSFVARLMLHRMRQWDLASSYRVDSFVANSHFIRDRIKKVYRRTASVIYPPVDLDAFPLLEEKEEYYLVASRLVPYKRVDLIVSAFAQMPERHLKVIGDGPEREKVCALAKGRPNIEVLGYQPSDLLAEQMAKAKAFVFAAEEDFGIAPVEAQSTGTPVIALGRGGALETVVGIDLPGPTGVFFASQTVRDIVAAVSVFEERAHEFHPRNCRRNAERFSARAFRSNLRRHVEDEWANFTGKRFTEEHILEDV